MRESFIITFMSPQTLCRKSMGDFQSEGACTSPLSDRTKDAVDALDAVQLHNLFKMGSQLNFLSTTRLMKQEVSALTRVPHEKIIGSRVYPCDHVRGIERL